MTQSESAAVTALLLAGSRGPEDPVARASGLSHKALAPIGGRPMIEHVLEALVATRRVGRIIAVIERPPLLEELPMVRDLMAKGRLKVETAAPSPSQSVTQVLDRHEPYPALLTTADHPLLTPAMIEELLEGMPADADVAALVARDRTIQGAFPETRRTYLRFSDAAVSGCNLFALPTPEGRRVIAFWRRLERDRKRPFRMAWSLGPTTLLRFALRRLTLSQAVEAIGRQAGVHAAVVESRFATAAIDVDKPEDLVLVNRIVTERAGLGASL